MAWGVRHYLIARCDYTTLKKITLTIGASAFFLTEMARSFYRPYIYANDIDDWVIADTIGNSLGTVAAVFMILTMSGRGTSWDWRLVGMVIAGLIGYEMLPVFGNRPFDVNDVVATIVFGCVSIVAYARILTHFGVPTTSREVSTHD
jgi:L-rhamnose isomerase